MDGAGEQRKRRTELLQQQAGLIDYLMLKVQAHDWHGVADAAMDLREVEAQLKMLPET